MTDIMKVMIDDEIVELSKDESEKIRLEIEAGLANDFVSTASAQKAKSDLLNKLGITADEAKLLLA
jgi:hypothetical protein